ncbi:MAG: hypothetical protein K0U13_05500 [Chlamydiae bacterium]|nr:hypothetical protein [Chlamydiota bacterium]
MRPQRNDLDEHTVVQFDEIPEGLQPVQDIANTAIDQRTEFEKLKAALEIDFLAEKAPIEVTEESIIHLIYSPKSSLQERVDKLPAEQKAELQETLDAKEAEFQKYKDAASLHNEWVDTAATMDDTEWAGVVEHLNSCRDVKGWKDFAQKLVDKRYQSRIDETGHKLEYELQIPRERANESDFERYDALLTSSDQLRCEIIEHQALRADKKSTLERKRGSHLMPQRPEPDYQSIAQFHESWVSYLQDLRQFYKLSEEERVVFEAKMEGLQAVRNQINLKTQERAARWLSAPHAVLSAASTSAIAVNRVERKSEAVEEFQANDKKLEDEIAVLKRTYSKCEDSLKAGKNFAVKRKSFGREVKYTAKDVREFKAVRKSRVTDADRAMRSHSDDFRVKASSYVESMKSYKEAEQEIKELEAGLAQAERKLAGMLAEQERGSAEILSLKPRIEREKAIRESIASYKEIVESYNYWGSGQGHAAFGLPKPEARSARTLLASRVSEQDLTCLGA